MKISYESHPALASIKMGYIPILIDDIDEVDKPFLKDVCNGKIPDFIKSINLLNIIVPTENFRSASAKSVKSIETHFEYDDFIKMDNSGVLIFSEYIMFFKLKHTPLKKIVMEYIILDNKFMTLLSFCFSPNPNNGKCEIFFSKLNTFELFKGKKETPTNFFLLLNLFNVQLLFFKAFAQVEIKHLLAGQKEHFFECNYENNTYTGITFLDSKWFTTLVKSDAFKVRGHFRLQPKKENGQWTKELIWISDFQKEGYTAPARKLLQNGNAINS